MNGYIKLYRQSLESSVFKNEKLWKVWTYCLMRANHRSGYKDFFVSQEITLKAGQFITGRFQGAKDCNMSPSTFRDQIEKLRRMKNLDTVSDNKKTLVTLVNWEQYQGSNTNPDIPPDMNPTTIRHESDTDKNKRIKEGKKKNIYSIENLPVDLNGECFIKTKFFFATRSLISELREKLRLDLSDESLREEFYRMEVWIESHKPKQNYKMFFANWLKNTKTNKQGNSTAFKRIAKGEVTDQQLAEGLDKAFR